ncbi:thiamine pyrophosphate-dependent dehydrogenase E1 component subunit alpha [Streptococcus danieliae]|uniref:Thiamine pyrophosphate-dependent dehydrogenase E1 component subunit alpha n=1 Tax=Streptococcus danieliae TaxID=747656 RepID=A0A7Z0LBY6_9STRE|nr:thiamine pyrophosphate-dependent dehydrogenase E1 component subunit alpha [Streptococcus danieliae]MBF0716619.1 thiamine pyrophosphate-dependent dehydrogenase E1 component subunit alpha [Streptococcus danieliae]NYS48549.1 thiamine pyrophosphate-dependent dehydrogenase E1 component subunit alpha [Streptococcus danieliae]
MSKKWTPEMILSWYETMVRIRQFENILDDYNSQGKVYGTTHLYNGEEAIATAILSLADPADLVLSTHRNHGHAIAKGLSTKAMYAEIFGRQSGTNQGRAGSMQISDFSKGFIGGNGIVGGNFPIALGLAKALQMDQKDQVVLCFSGDGATNEGTFHESLNLASVWKLPVLFIIENNQYAMSSYTDHMTAGDIVTRGHNYGMKSLKVNGQDIFAVAEAFAQARQALKEGPVLMEVTTYRFRGHSRSDKEDYRTKDEYLNYQDPIVALRGFILSEGYRTQDELAFMEEAIYQTLMKEAGEAFVSPAAEQEVEYG